MNFRRIACAAMAAVMTVSVCGCSIKVGTNKKIKDTAVVASTKVSDDKSMNVTYGEFRKEYAYWMKANQYTDDSLETVADSCKAQRANIINYLINEKILLAKAAQMGLDKLTDEESREIQDDFDAAVKEQVEYFASVADYGTDDTSTISDEEKEKRGNEDFDKYLTDCDLTRDDLFMWQVNAAITAKLINEVTKDITASREDAQAEYDEIVDKVKETYENDISTYESSASYTTFWLPEGARNIKHVLLSFEDAEEIMSLRSAGDDAAADELRMQRAEEMTERTQEIINMLDNGADIDELIPEYSADAKGSSVYPDGYLIVPGGSKYMAEFQQAAMELENVGDYKTCVTDYGVHIVLYASKAAVSEETKNEVVDYLFEELDSSKKDSHFADLLNQWKAEYNYEIDYEALKIDEPAAAE